MKINVSSNLIQNELTPQAKSPEKFDFGCFENHVNESQYGSELRDNLSDFLNQDQSKAQIIPPVELNPPNFNQIKQQTPIPNNFDF